MEVLCWINHVWFSNECAYCVCDPSVHLDVPYIGFDYVCVYVGSYLLILAFGSWVIGICSPRAVSLCDFAYYVVE